MCKTIGKSIIILLAGILTGTILLWISYLLPVSEDSVHVIESVDILDQEGWYPTAPLMRQYVGVPIGRNGGGIMDNFTDSIMITTAGHKPVEGALYQAMNMASDVAEEGYSYYWHGYVVILRPLLLFLNYADIRVINQLVQMIIVTFMTCMVYRKKGFAYAALPLTLYGLLMPMAVSQSLQYSWVFYIGMIGSLAIVKFHDQLSKGQRICFFFLILGMLTSYLDLLTYPLFTWGIPMIWWIVMDDDKGGAKRQLQQVVLCGISWIFGYGGLWAGKWLVGQAVTHKPILMQAWNEVLYRGGRIQNDNGRLAAHQATVLSNLKVCINVQVVFLLGLWIVYWCYKVIKNPYRIKKEKTLPLLLVALSPISWYIVLENHTCLHSNFTYRICMIGIMALLASMINSWEAGNEIRQYNKRNRIIPVAMVLIAILIALNMKDEIHVHNGNYEVTNLQLKEQIPCIQEFQPTYSRIGSMNICLSAENEGAGEIDVKILEEDGNSLWEYSVPAEEIVGGAFYEFPVKLRLDRKKTYQISISGRNLTGNKVWVGVAGMGQHPLAELSSFQIGNQKYDTQLTFGVLYRYRANIFKLAFTAQLQLLIYWNLYLLIGIVLHRRESISIRGGKLIICK